MPKVYRVTDLKKRQSVIISDMFKSNDDYIFIGNETQSNKSYVIVRPAFLIRILKSVGLENDANFITDTVALVKKKVSEKYKEIRRKG